MLSVWHSPHSVLQWVLDSGAGNSSRASTAQLWQPWCDPETCLSASSAGFAIGLGAWPQRSVPKKWSKMLKIKCLSSKDNYHTPRANQGAHHSWVGTAVLQPSPITRVLAASFALNWKTEFDFRDSFLSDKEEILSIGGENWCRAKGYDVTVPGSLVSCECLSRGHILWPWVAAEAGMQELIGRQEEIPNKSLGGKACGQKSEDT